MEDEADKYESNTVGGWVTEKFGEIPPIGQIIVTKGLEIKIVKATKQKVLKVRSKRSDEATDDEEEND